MEFLESLAKSSPASALLVLHMRGLSGLDGLDVLDALRMRRLKIPTIIITGNARSDMRERCINAGAVAYLQKPLDRDVVLLTIQTATVN